MIFSEFETQSKQLGKSKELTVISMILHTIQRLSCPAMSIGGSGPNAFKTLAALDHSQPTQTDSWCV